MRYRDDNIKKVVGRQVREPSILMEQVVVIVDPAAGLKQRKISRRLRKKTAEG